MSVANPHITTTTRVWDGLSYQMMGVKEAKRLEKQGVVQMCENLTAAQLKTAAQFDEARSAIADKAMKSSMPPGMDGKKVDKRSKAYRDKQMKAEG